MTSHAHSHARWPADRFYWCVVHAPTLRRPGVLPDSLAAVLHDHAPVDPMSLHVVYVPVAQGQAVVCAATHSQIEEIDPITESLSPESLPDFITGRCNAAELNLLVGRYEPRTVTRARTRRHARRAIALLACAGLIATGLHRRASFNAARAAAASDAASSAVASMGPGCSVEALRQEAIRLRAAATLRAGLNPSPDASVALASLLRAWPPSVPSKPQSLAVVADTMSVAVTVEGDAAPFLREFQPPIGWALDEPRLNTSDNISRLSLQLRKAGIATGERTNAREPEPRP